MARHVALELGQRFLLDLANAFARQAHALCQRFESLGLMVMQTVTPGQHLSLAVVEPQEFAFAGTVESVDTTTRIVVVANEAIPGWMMAMSMNYFVEPPEVLATLNPGDRITATVRSGDFQNLYEVEVIR